MDRDRLDLAGIDLTGLSREDVLAALTDAAIEAYEDAAEFYSPDQARDWRGRWTSGGGEGGQSVPTHAERGQLRQASLQAVREYVRAGGQPSQVENEQLAAHLARLTVAQLHQVKAEHGLKASGKDKAALVTKLVERFRAHRATQAPAGKRALEEAVKDRPGFHNVREVVGGHAVRHGPTGSQVRADHAGTRFDVLTSGSTLHSSHATAAAAVKAAEASNRFGTGQSTAEQEYAARQEAMRKARERAAQAQKPTATPPPAGGGAGQPYHQRVEVRRETIHGLNADRAYIDGAVHGTKTGDQAAAEAFKHAADQAGVHRDYHAELARQGFPSGDAQQAVSALRQVAEGKVTPGEVSRQWQSAFKESDEMSRYKHKQPFGLREDYERRQAELDRKQRLFGWLSANMPRNKADRAAVLEALDKPGMPRKRTARFSVAGALSPQEAEERAALRRVQSYADRENARLRAVREGVRA